jgi:F0F1-type ATP synthase assembly protein I
MSSFIKISLVKNIIFGLLFGVIYLLLDYYSELEPTYNLIIALCIGYFISPRLRKHKTQMGYVTQVFWLGKKVYQE